MATNTLDIAETIYQEARQLPPESLLDLAKFVEFLKYKASVDKPEHPERGDNVLIRLDGILAGYDFSPELLAEARRELWHGFGEIES